MMSVMKRVISIVIVILVLILSGCGSATKVETTSQGTIINQTISTDDYPMQNTPDSSCFSAIGYKGGNLVVTFRDSGASYIYFDVPRSIWNNLKSADSMGSYYNSNIKGQFNCEKLER